MDGKEHDTQITQMDGREGDTQITQMDGREGDTQITLRWMEGRVTHRSHSDGWKGA